VRPDRVKGTDGAQPGDALVLAGALGTGIYAAAHAKQRLVGDDRAALIAEATHAHAAGIALGPLRNVHAIAAVGPTGLIGAALALADAASLPVALAASRVPALPRALALAKSGIVAPQSSRNWNRDGARVDLAETVMPEMRALLTDPQTSGALLIACKAQSVERVVRLCEASGEPAAEIGAFGSAEDQAPRPLSIGA
jgi:selenide, water dikinase